MHIAPLSKQNTQRLCKFSSIVLLNLSLSLSAGLFSSHTTTIASETHQSTQTRRRPAPVQVTPPASPFEIKEKLVDKWVLNNRRYFKFTGKITNISNKTIKTARFVVHRLYSQLWGLDKVRGNGNIYALPAAVKLLKPGESVEFAYVKQFGKAQIYVRSYTYV